MALSLAAVTGWIAAGSIVGAGLVPLVQRLRAGKRGAPGSPPVRLHVTFGFVTSSVAFGHTLTVVPALGSEAATAGGMMALLPGGLAFFLLVAHAGLGLQLRRDKLRDRVAKRRAHTFTALSIATMVAWHAVALLRAR